MMEQKRERIKKFCGVIYVVLTAAVIVYTVAALSHLMYEIWKIFEFRIDTMPIMEINFKLLYFGNSAFALPAIDFGFVGYGTRPEDPPALVMTVAAGLHALYMFGMFFVRSIFRDLRNGGSPFSRKIIFGAYFVATVMFWSGVLDRRPADIFLAILVGLFCLIFDYGRILQEEADTTL